MGSPAIVRWTQLNLALRKEAAAIISTQTQPGLWASHTFMVSDPGDPERRLLAIYNQQGETIYTKESE